VAGLRRRPRPVIWLVAALLLIGAAAPSAGPADAAGLSDWTGGVNLYRKGVYSMQQTWSWCTSADVQMIRNIVDRDDDHSAANQRRYFQWMRKRNRYDIPVSAGVDPVGWTAGLRHFVDDRYRLVASKTFDGALRLAVKRLRLTSLPVVLAVAHGTHGWILHGFTATADPAKSTDYTITSVRVTGPLWGRQSKNGYDMPPNTKLTPAQLKRFFTPWKYKPLPMIWDGTYVSIQPVPKKAAAASAAAPAASPSPPPSPLPSPSPSPVPSAAPSASSPAPVVAIVRSSAAPSLEPVGPGASARTPTAVPADPTPTIAGIGLLTAALIVGLLVASRRAGSGHRPRP